jgi:hypothetical protein
MSTRGKQNFQIQIQHAHQARPVLQSYASPDTAIGAARQAYEQWGAERAVVIRKTDGKVIYDGPAGIEVDYTEYYS